MNCDYVKWSNMRRLRLYPQTLYEALATYVDQVQHQFDEGNVLGITHRQLVMTEEGAVVLEVTRVR